MQTSASAGQGWSHLPRPEHEVDQPFRWSEAGWWAWEDLNLRPHPERRIPVIRPSCGEGLEGDVVAEGLELGDGSLAGTVGVAADEVVAAQVGIATVVGQQVPGDHQDRVADGEGGLLLANAPGQPPELGRQVGVTGSRRSPGALDEDLTEPAVPLAGPAGSALAAGHVVAGAASRPGGQVGGAGEHRHVDPDLGDDALGGPLADPGDRVEAVTGPRERGDDPVDLRVELGDGPLQLLDVVQGQPQQQGVVGGEAPA